MSGSGFREANWAVFQNAGERPWPGISSSRDPAVRTSAGGRRELTGLPGGRRVTRKAEVQGSELPRARPAPKPESQGRVGGALSALRIKRCPGRAALGWLGTPGAGICEQKHQSGG